MSAKPKRKMAKTLEALLREKEVYDYLKPLFKTDIDPIDLNLIWNIPLYQALKLNILVKALKDLTSLGGIASPNNAGVEIVAGLENKRIKVYDAGFHGAVDGLHYFYFGTSTTSTTKRFCSMNLKGLIHKTFVQPRIGATEDGLYLFASVAETNMPYDVGYVQEA